MTLEPTLLTGKLRLQEIYDLRVNVWEYPGKSEFVNRQLFPNGWLDELDDTGLHWVIINDQNEIIAAARLNLFDNFEDFPYYPFIRHLNIPDKTPFGFYSRLVIHPEYQGLGLSVRLASSRLRYCEEREIFWLQVFVTNERVKNLYEKLKFQVVGQTEINYHEHTQPHSVSVFVKEYQYDI